MERLTDFGIEHIAVKKLCCRVCNEPITKWFVTSFSNRSVRYGYCRKTSHGITIERT